MAEYFSTLIELKDLGERKCIPEAAARTLKGASREVQKALEMPKPNAYPR
jgi:hypothetical protein